MIFLTKTMVFLLGKFIFSLSLKQEVYTYTVQVAYQIRKQK
jgi:hypothetical protein